MDGGKKLGVILATGGRKNLSVEFSASLSPVSRFHVGYNCHNGGDCTMPGVVEPVMDKKEIFSLGCCKEEVTTLARGA